MKNDKYFCPAFKKTGKKELFDRAKTVSDTLRELYPEAECALQYGGDPFRLLVMARLSAQCTDKRVNEVSQELFRAFPDAFAMAQAPLEEIEKLVRSCGVYRVKAKNILDMSRIIVSEYGGMVPDTKEKLLSLPGVGEKIANLMLGDVFRDPHIVADTHCIRLSNRFGFLSSADPSKTVKALEEYIPYEERSDFCHRMVLFGREYCKAPTPDCASCPFMNNKK